MQQNKTKTFKVGKRHQHPKRSSPHFFPAEARKSFPICFQPSKRHEASMAKHPFIGGDEADSILKGEELKHQPSASTLEERREENTSTTHLPFYCS